MIFRIIVVFFALVVSFFPSFIQPVVAGSYVHGAKGAGMGAAFSAISDDPSAMAHNPAGIGFQSGTRLYLGGIALMPETQFKNPTGNVEETKSQVYGAPHLYMTSEIADSDITLGFAVFSPFGIGGRTWSEQGITRYLSTENLISTLEANPTIAWRPLPNLSLAFGAVYLWTDETMVRMVDQSMLQAADGRIGFEGDGSGWGWNLGLLWKPLKTINIGAAYRSGVHVGITGNIKLEDIAPALQPLFGGQQMTTGARTSHDLPSIATLSTAWLPNDRWTLVLEGEWVDWSTFDKQTIEINNPIPAAGFTDISMTMDWEDSWLFKIGTEYKFNESWALRGGYTYITSQVPSATLTPANPDASQHYYSIGLGFSLTRLTMDLFYSFTVYEDRIVTNDILSGEYSSKCHAFGASMGWKF